MSVGLTRDNLIGQATEGERSPSVPFSARRQVVDLGPSKYLKPEQQSEPAPERLAERAQAGCLEAFEQLVVRYGGHVYNFLRQFTGNHHDAEDLTQETFVKAHLSLHRYNSSLSFPAWLFTIARRTGASHFRSAYRFEELPAVEESVQENPASVLERKDEQNSIWKLVRTLKPKQAEALWLRYAEGFSVAETARIMRTNQIHVKVLLHRARGNLAKRLIAGRSSSNHADKSDAYEKADRSHLLL